MGRAHEEETEQSEGGPMIMIISFVLGIVAMIGIFLWIQKVSEDKLKTSGQWEKVQQDNQAIEAEEEELALEDEAEEPAEEAGE